MGKDDLINEYKKNEERQEEILRELAAIHKIDPIEVGNQENNSKVCFVFSCPGREEMMKGRPCQGETGENLSILIKILHEKKPEIFSGTAKEDYDIINASNVVHFEALDGITEGTKQEIEKNENIEKYVNDNKELKYVILFGEKAKIVCEKLKKEGVKVIETRHLSFLSLNQIDKTSDEKQIKEIPDSVERTKARLGVVAKEIIDEIEKKTKK